MQTFVPRDSGPSILAVTSGLPWPLNSGGHLRSFHLLKSLAGRFRVRLVTQVTPQSSSGLAPVAALGVEIVSPVTEPKTLAKEALSLLSAAARGEPYVLYRRHRSNLIRLQIDEQLAKERPAAVYLDHLDSFAYHRSLNGIPLVLDLHNVYSRLTQRVAQDQPGIWKRFYLRREARLLAMIERQAAAECDLLLAVSEEERRYFEALGAGTWIVPNGVDCAAYESLPIKAADSEAPTILYIGDMGWLPNIDAAEFLATIVLPAVRQQLPGARLQIVGRNPAARVNALSKLANVHIAGTVSDVRPYLEAAAMLAVPLSSGGGTRLKILEAFAAGVPVVSTPVGCEGIAALDREHLLIADCESFSSSVLQIIVDAEGARQMAQRARDMVRSRYDWTRIGEEACAAVSSVVAPAHSLPAIASARASIQ